MPKSRMEVFGDMPKELKNSEYSVYQELNDFLQREWVYEWSDVFAVYQKLLLAENLVGRGVDKDTLQWQMFHAMYHTHRWVNGVLDFLNLKYPDISEYVSRKVSKIFWVSVDRIPIGSTCVFSLCNHVLQKETELSFDFSKETSEDILHKVHFMEIFANSGFDLSSLKITT